MAWTDVDERFGVDVALAGVVEFPRRRAATVSCSFKASNQGWYMILGSEGIIEVSGAFVPGWGQLAAEAIVTVYAGDNNRCEEVVAPVDQYQLMVEDVASAVLVRGPVPYPRDDAVSTMRALDALAARGSAVPIG